MEINIKKDLSLLTNLDEKLISKIFDKINWCICDGISSAEYKDDHTLICDLGFGELIIFVGDDQVKYKFIPSAELEKSINSTVINCQNPLEISAEKTLARKITKVYKDLL